ETCVVPEVGVLAPPGRHRGAVRSPWRHGSCTARRANTCQGDPSPGLVPGGGVPARTSSASSAAYPSDNSSAVGTGTNSGSPSQWYLSAKQCQLTAAS